jgi:hypothetical protein
VGVVPKQTLVKALEPPRTTVAKVEDKMLIKRIVLFAVNVGGSMLLVFALASMGLLMMLLALSGNSR